MEPSNHREDFQIDYNRGLFLQQKDCTKDQQNTTKLFLPHSEKVIGI
jgi:hypothetical protein